MKLHISTKDNKIYVDKKINIQCFTEYGLKYQKIKCYSINNKKESKEIESILLIPFTHITNIWHLLHQLFIFFKFVKKNNIKKEYFYFIFFQGFYERQGEILKTNYIDLIFKGFGLDIEKYKELDNIFKQDNCINVKGFQIVNEKINFNSEPMMKEFKEYFLDNFKINKNLEPEGIVFILRRGTREITNIDFVKNNLPCNINYVYLEDYNVEKQLELISKSKIVIGVHGAGLTWSVFMKENCTLVELYPGNSNTDNYIRWCKISGLNYKRVCVNITKGNANDFRKATVNIDSKQLDIIKKYIN